MVHIDGDPCDAAELTRMETTTFTAAMKCFLAFRESVAGWSQARLAGLSPQFGVREGRRYKGLATLSRKEVDSGKIHSDSIYRHTCSSEGKEYTIPYRCLVPEKVDGLLAGCRCISVEKSVFPSLRLIGHGEGIGMAAGAAAGLCAVQGVEPRDLEPEKLQAFLRDTIQTVV
jgi:hypothetical protein